MVTAIAKVTITLKDMIITHIHINKMIYQEKNLNQGSNLLLYKNLKL